MHGRFWNAKLVHLKRVFEMCYNRGAIAIISLAFLSCLCFTRAAIAEHRLAFVVGIDTYFHLGPDAQLQRAVADAENVGSRLKELGFTVSVMARDASVDQDQFLKRFSAWTRDIQPGDTALFYFAGHGVGIAGTNFLAPSDMPDLADADEFLFRAHAISETEIRSRIQARGAGVTVMLLDACRNNPFKSSDRSIALSRGLEPIESTMGVLTIYAAGYGQTALDRLSDTNDPDPNSLFTRVLLSEMIKPGVSLLDLSENLREKVARLAHSAGHDQVPAVDNQLLGGRSVFLAGPPAATPNISTEALDEVAWRYIHQTTDASLLNQFISEYPESHHKGEALALLMHLERSTNSDNSDRHAKSFSSPNEPQPEVDAPSVDEFTWPKIAQSHDPQTVRDFVRQFPRSTHHLAAEEHLRQLDTAAWNFTDPNSLNALGAYTANFPDGVHHAEALKLVANLESPKTDDKLLKSFHVTPPVRNTVLPPFTLGIAVGLASDLDGIVARDFIDILQTGQETGPKGQTAVSLIALPGLTGEQTVADVTSRPGVDLGVVPISVLEQIDRDGPFGDLRKKLMFVSMLPSQNVLILTLDPSISSISDLKDKVVNVGLERSNEDLIAERIFDLLDVSIKPVHYALDAALDQLVEGKVTALVTLSPIGVASRKTFGEMGEVSSLHLVSVPGYRFNGKSLLHVKLTHDDFPDLIAADDAIDSIAAPSVLVTSSLGPKSQHYGLLDSFLRLLFGRWDALSKSQKTIWRDIKPTTILAGWNRFKPAEQWVSLNIKATQPIARVNR